MNRFLPNTYLFSVLSNVSLTKLIQKYSSKLNSIALFKRKPYRMMKHACVMLAASTVLSACSTTKNNSDKVQHAQHQQLIYATEQLQQCKAQGHDISEAASHSQSLPQYLLAAKHFRACSQNLVFDESNRVNSAITQVSESDVIPVNVKQYKTVAMQLYVKSVINFIKAGELDSASEMVIQFKQTFPQQDFYFSNYTSFIDTAEALLQPEHITPQVLATLNISAPLRQELLRKQYWLRN